jgi:hypothetical protein
VAGLHPSRVPDAPRLMPEIVLTLVELAAFAAFWVAFGIFLGAVVIL